jgi:hypothetical protein
MPISMSDVALLGTGPGFLQPIGRRCGGADEILHADDHDGGLAAAVDDEALIVFGGEIHDLAELSPGDTGIDAAVHGAFSPAGRR